MKYLHAAERNGGYVVELRDADVPVPRAGEVLVRVAGSGVNRADLSQIAGRYPPPPGESEILGLEASGIVEGAGERVCALLAGGGHAEYVAVPAGQVFPAPARIDLVSAAAIPEAWLTAFQTLVVEGAVSPGATVLVHAGASGVGLAAIQLAKLCGARVAATTRTAAKLAALAEAGADVAVDTSRGDFGAALEARWGANSVDVILDPVGAATLSRNLAILAMGGRIICIATMGGARGEMDLALLMRKRARLVGSTLRARSRGEKAQLVARFREAVLPGFDRGALRVSVDAVFPPARAAEAFQRMRDNKNTGKILIDWGAR